MSATRADARVDELLPRRTALGKRVGRHMKLLHTQSHLHVLLTSWPKRSVEGECVFVYSRVQNPGGCGRVQPLDDARPKSVERHVAQGRKGLGHAKSLSGAGRAWRGFVSHLGRSGKII